MHRDKLHEFNSPDVTSICFNSIIQLCFIFHEEMAGETVPYSLESLEAQNLLNQFVPPWILSCHLPICADALFALMS